MHLLVTQLHFTRSELVRCLDGVTDDDAKKRFESMNSISWIIGHLADQENRYWVRFAQGEKFHPELKELVGYGRPASTPNLDEMWMAWREITGSADRYLENVTSQDLDTNFQVNGKSIGENVGTLLMRNIYHYWFHTGEAYAIRQLLGHRNLPEFVGNMTKAKYQPGG
jgi:uncharacterized damage-inducible protein DinB